MSLATLPPEVLGMIARQLYDPFTYTTEQERLQYVVPPFVQNTGPRRVELNSFLAFSTTCRNVRKALRPLVFTSIRVHNFRLLREVLASDWKQYVR